MTNLADKEHGTLNVGGKMKLLRANVDVAGHDVIHYDVLHKSALIVFFFVIDLGTVQSDGG